MSTTSPPGFLEGALDRVIHETHKTKPLLPLYLHLILSSIFPIFIAAHASLRRPSSAAPVKKNKKSRRITDQDSDTEEESSSPIETLTTTDAILFPILAGGTLTGLYVTIKWLEDPSILNKILGYYFNWIGTFFTFKLVRDGLYLIRSLVFPTQFSRGGTVYKYNATSDSFDVTGNNGATLEDVNTAGAFGRPFRALPFLAKARRRLYYKATCTLNMRKPLSSSKISFSITALDIVAALISALLSFTSVYLGKTPWYLTNLQGFSFCYGSLQFMTPGTSATGSLLLSLLFFYDIYMVFYTPMMVTVATKLEVPIKLLFPRPDDGTCPKPIGALPGSEEMEQYLKCLAKKRTMAMLGLGDIVVPGIMIAFALRFDLYRFYLKMKQQGKAGATEASEERHGKDQKARPTYTPARGMWAERFYTAKTLWSPALKAKSFPKPYFKATMVGYVLGMIATLLVMQVWQHAQPALLYLVPGVLISFWGMALSKREIKLLWNYDEAEEDKEKEKKEEADKKNKQESKSKEEESTKKEGAEEKKSTKSKDDAKDNKEKDPDRPVFSFNIYVPSTRKPFRETESTPSTEAHGDSATEDTLQASNSAAS
ncbi:hypothetical protein OHC33_009697 [Knufia fluminis]|uniref:Signal peptide peptidase n=1 Tax=Knufia fluminis TaxID=191047 RepID=A0AAN8E944_9EURO|nr:hypothetical protein OHC33_009697 [Knufia fluminis]